MLVLVLAGGVVWDESFGFSGSDLICTICPFSSERWWEKERQVVELGQCPSAHVVRVPPSALRWWHVHQQDERGMREAQTGSLRC